MTVSASLLSAIQARIAEGASIRSIAMEAGIAEPSLNRFVNGRRSLSLEAVDKLAELFGMDLLPIPPRTKKPRR